MRIKRRKASLGYVAQLIEHEANLVAQDVTLDFGFVQISATTALLVVFLNVFALWVVVVWWILCKSGGDKDSRVQNELRHRDISDAMQVNERKDYLEPAQHYSIAAQLSESNTATGVRGAGAAAVRAGSNSRKKRREIDTEGTKEKDTDEREKDIANVNLKADHNVAQVDSERQAREDNECKAREEEERRAREEAERKDREEGERRAREEAERKSREEGERSAREEAERKDREEGERRAREEAERKAREEEERRAREEAEREAREEAERLAREAAERELRRERAAFEAEDDEANQRELEERERLEAEQLAAETGNFQGEQLAGLEDLTKHTNLDEDIMLETIRRRFEKDRVYTFTGATLLSVNPFKRIDDLYSEETLKSFQSIKMLKKPHVFSVSYRAYHTLKAKRVSQSILISGESGAGKTEAQKYVMRFIASAGSHACCASTVEEQMLSASPILEALGNAKTVRNSNSSRFGKFVELNFASGSEHIHRDEALDRANMDLNKEELRVKSLKIETYLLETVRVTETSQTERNYHIFYQIVAAGKADGKASDFKYLNQSKCLAIDGVDDKKEFDAVEKSMKVLGLETTFEDLVSAMRGILHLGNVEFATENDNTIVTAESTVSLEAAAQAFGLDACVLQQTLSFDPFTVPGRSTMTMKMKSAKEAEISKDSLAQRMYGEMFDEVVSRINDVVGAGHHESLFCGMLDIFGFEHFKSNSFEQLCINYANEILQGVYNDNVFRVEERLYAREGLVWNPVDVPDNQGSIDLIGKPGGVMAMLDEETIMPGGCDKSFCSKLVRQHGPPKKLLYGDKRRQNMFTIKHYAGDVMYTVDGFVEKNKLTFAIHTVNCLATCKNELIAISFGKLKEKEMEKAQAATSGAKKKKRDTVSSNFSQQLNSLLKIVSETDVHFIRCIKATPQNKPDIFEDGYVQGQVKCGGVLQAIQVSRSGFPVRMSHRDCYLDYYYLLKGSKLVDEVSDMSKAIAELMKCLDDIFSLSTTTAEGDIVQTYAVGKNMVFFKQSTHDYLQAIRMRIRNYFAMKVQIRYKKRHGR
eukprot:TRINITY_DN6349_c0_g2_i2.p1 TRINITY_DN6349_c0_g2~~TRINITY_DN6349_c0_g2_i2.p1  ORF type:complete len:1049 (-),score=172.03 TRINITY_DN6349_c0_g2_i2:167-3313(-)